MHPLHVINTCLVWPLTPLAGVVNRTTIFIDLSFELVELLQGSYQLYMVILRPIFYIYVSPLYFAFIFH